MRKTTKKSVKSRTNLDRNDETTIKLHCEILRILKQNGPKSATYVATCLGEDKARVRKCLGTLARKKFLRGSKEQDGRINYRLILSGDIFLQNLEALMNEDRFSVRVAESKVSAL